MLQSLRHFKLQWQGKKTGQSKSQFEARVAAQSVS